MKKKIRLKNGEYAELLQFVVVSNIVHAVVKTNDNRIDVVHHREIIFPEMVEVENMYTVEQILKAGTEGEISSININHLIDVLKRLYGTDESPNDGKSRTKLLIK